MCLVHFLFVSTSAVNCLERLVPEMTCYMLSGTLNPTHSLTHLHWFHGISGFSLDSCHVDLPLFTMCLCLLCQMIRTKVPAPQWTRAQRALAWLSLGIFCVGFIFYMVGYTGHSWYVAPVVNEHYPPENPITPIQFGLFYLCYRGECKYDLRQDYQVMELLPPALGQSDVHSQLLHLAVCVGIITGTPVTLCPNSGNYCPNLKLSQHY